MEEPIALVMGAECQIVFIPTGDGMILQIYGKKPLKLFAGYWTLQPEISPNRTKTLRSINASRTPLGLIRAISSTSHAREMDILPKTTFIRKVMWLQEALPTLSDSEVNQQRPMIGLLGVSRGTSDGASSSESDDSSLVEPPQNIDAPTHATLSCMVPTKGHNKEQSNGVPQPKILMSIRFIHMLDNARVWTITDSTRWSHSAWRFRNTILSMT
jgi:hypothetical protein